MELHFDDEDFRERVRQMLRGRAPGQFRFCDDNDSQVCRLEIVEMPHAQKKHASLNDNYVSLRYYV